MRKVLVLTDEEAANLVKDGDTLTTSGFCSCSLPETLNKALEKRFLATGKPEALTISFVAGQGNRDGSGPDHFAYAKMVKRVIAGHWNMVPKLGELALKNEIEGYNLPQGILSSLLRDSAAHRAGMTTHVGLNTFVDPRKGGGRVNSKTQEALVELVDIQGEEKLFYKSFSIDIAFIRGTYADEAGNITFEKEVASLDATSMAQAVKNSGGKVIVQVEKIVKAGTLDPRLVKIPGIYVHAVVVASEADQQQSLGCDYDPALSGEIRVPEGGAQNTPLTPKKLIGRRAAMELEKNIVVNLGIGVPEYVAGVAGEEGIGDYMTLTVEDGPIGGIPQSGVKFGSSCNPECIVDQGYQFDFYDGGGLDSAFLGLAQADADGNINVSKFGPRIAGCGGFINITQNTKNVFFCGTFTAGGLKTKVENGQLIILQEGQELKFVKAVDQITFSGEYAMKTGQRVRYITERAVFELRKDGIYLIEVAPGIDIRTQVIDLMGFVPKIDGEVKRMNEAIFKDELMGLKNMI